MLQPGKHLVTVRNCGFKPAQETFPEQLAIYFEDDAGEGITWYHALGFTKEGFSKAAFKYACDQLRGLGWDAEANELKFEMLGDPATSPIFGVQCEIVVA